MEFGAGFEAARMRGSEHNDPIISPDGTTATNNAGGIAGGITNGNPVVVRAVVVKPTSSISSPQITLNTETGKPEELQIKGRHDACIALRAPVVVEAAMAIALCDLTLIANRNVHSADDRPNGISGTSGRHSGQVRKVRFPLARIGYSIIHGRFGNYV